MRLNFATPADFKFFNKCTPHKFLSLIMIKCIYCTHLIFESFFKGFERALEIEILTTFCQVLTRKKLKLSFLCVRCQIIRVMFGRGGEKRKREFHHSPFFHLPEFLMPITKYFFCQKILSLSFLIPE